MVLDRVCGCVRMGRATQCEWHGAVRRRWRARIEALRSQWSLHQPHVRLLQRLFLQGFEKERAGRLPV